jgi:hypothetical protein
MHERLMQNNSVMQGNMGGSREEKGRNQAKGHREKASFILF